MLKKTSASIGLVVATAAGIMLSGAPAQAQSSSISNLSFGHHFRHHSSNWNGNRTRPRIFIRIFIYNRNNNVAVARNEQRQRERERQRQLQRERFRRGMQGAPMQAEQAAPMRAQDLRGRDALAPAPLIGPRRTWPAPASHSLSAPRTNLTPRNNGQISRNGVVHGVGDQQSRPGAEEAGQNGIQANPGIDSPNQDIDSWLNPTSS